MKNWSTLKKLIWYFIKIHERVIPEESKVGNAIVGTGKVY